MKWLNRAGAAAGIIILAGFPIYSSYYSRIEQWDRQRLMSRVPGQGAPARMEQWIRAQVAESGSAIKQGGGEFVCLSKGTVRDRFRNTGAQVQVPELNNFQDRFFWDTGLNHFWVLVRYGPLDEPSFCNVLAVTYPRPESAIVGTGEGSRSLTFFLFAAWFMFTVLILGFRLRQYLAARPPAAPANAEAAAPGSEAWEKVWGRGRVYVPLAMLTVIVFSVQWQMENFDSNLRFYQCRLARWRMDRAHEKYKRYAGDVAIEEMLERRGEIYASFQKACRLANQDFCGRFGPAATVCLRLECRFPGPDSNFNKPAGCLYNTDYLTGAAFCIMHPDQ